MVCVEKDLTWVVVVVVVLLLALPSLQLLSNCMLLDCSSLSGLMFASEEVRSCRLLGQVAATSRKSQLS